MTPQNPSNQRTSFWGEVMCFIDSGQDWRGISQQFLYSKCEGPFRNTSQTSCEIHLRMLANVHLQSMYGDTLIQSDQAPLTNCFSVDLKTRLFFVILTEGHYLDFWGFLVTAAIVQHVDRECRQDPCLVTGSKPTKPTLACWWRQKTPQVQVKVWNRINNSSNLMRRLLGFEKYKNI